MASYAFEADHKPRASHSLASSPHVYEDTKTYGEAMTCISELMDKEGKELATALNPTYWKSIIGETNINPPS